MNLYLEFDVRECERVRGKILFGIANAICLMV